MLAVMMMKIEHMYFAFMDLRGGSSESGRSPLKFVGITEIANDVCNSGITTSIKPLTYTCVGCLFSENSYGVHAMQPHL